MNEVYKEFDMDEGEETNFTNVTLAIDDTLYRWKVKWKRWVFYLLQCLSLGRVAQSAEA